MKRTIIFFMSYKGDGVYGHHLATVDYSIFTRKSKIIKDLYDWHFEHQKSTKESIVTLSLKIIGL